MELKEFISMTFQQVIEGIEEAQKFAKEHKAEVNPGKRQTVYSREHLVIDRAGNVGQLIHFDIAVSTSEKSEAGGGAGLFVPPISLGAKGKTGSDSSSINRISFYVPVYLPFQGEPLREQVRDDTELQNYMEAVTNWLKGSH